MVACDRVRSTQPAANHAYKCDSKYYTYAGGKASYGSHLTGTGLQQSGQVTDTGAAQQSPELTAASTGGHISCQDSTHMEASALAGPRRILSSYAQELSCCLDTSHTGDVL